MKSQQKKLISIAQKKRWAKYREQKAKRELKKELGVRGRIFMSISKFFKKIGWA